MRFYGSVLIFTGWLGAMAIQYHWAPSIFRTPDVSVAVDYCVYIATALCGVFIFVAAEIVDAIRGSEK